MHFLHRNCWLIVGDVVVKLKLCSYWLIRFFMNRDLNMPNKFDIQIVRHGQINANQTIISLFFQSFCIIYTFIKNKRYEVATTRISLRNVNEPNFSFVLAVFTLIHSHYDGKLSL